ncbi:LysR family transcriptional regulator [Alphaproteobacteria bacterium LSUCC0684]
MRALINLKYVETVGREGSIRKAAEKLAITSTALNRRILALEEELGYPLFERLPSGVRLNTAGEIFVDFVRRQFSDLERVRSQMADLAGMRRGHIRIISSPEALKTFLPEQLALYRDQYPQVTFEVKRAHGAEAETALTRIEADIALTMEPVQSPQFKVMATAPQKVHVLMAADHPLAGKSEMRLRDCIGYPVILPSKRNGIRQLIDLSLLITPLPLAVVGESDSLDFLHTYLEKEHALSFQVPIAVKAGGESRLRAIPLSERDVKHGVLHVGHLKDRVLSVAASKFLEQIITALAATFPETS